MKKRTIIGMLLVACCATMCFVGGTFAKYTSNVENSATAVVAKWEVGAGNLAASFNLFEHTDTNTVSGKIAPGTSGSFAFNVSNKSEVTANYAITFTVQNENNIPVKFYSDSSFTTEITDTDGTYNAVSGTLAIGSTTEQTDEATIYWQWIFDGDDAADTSLGTAGTASITVAASVVFTQVD